MRSGVFLQQQGVNGETTQTALADTKAAVTRVICVRK